MAQDLYSIWEVADLLGLHVRTVRNYVRDGRLKAVRIGKQYRIAREDLEVLTGRPASAFEREPVRRFARGSRGGEQAERERCDPDPHPAASMPASCDIHVTTRLRDREVTTRANAA